MVGSVAFAWSKGKGVLATGRWRMEASSPSHFRSLAYNDGQSQVTQGALVVWLSRYLYSAANHYTTSLQPHTFRVGCICVGASTLTALRIASAAGKSWLMHTKRKPQSIQPSCFLVDCYLHGAQHLVPINKLFGQHGHHVVIAGN